jgi:hypothetical protein
MADFLISHFAEHFGRSGISLTQTVDKFPIDALVFLLIGDSERENFLFGQIAKVFHHELCEQVSGAESEARKGSGRHSETTS